MSNDDAVDRQNGCPLVPAKIDKKIKMVVAAEPPSPP